MGGRIRKIKQVFVPYYEWEDWINGMWVKQGDIEYAIEFTGDWKRYGEAMGEVIEAWPRTMLNSLTNQSINRRAFLGHCAVCYKLGISESVTREAWGLLSDQQRYDADAIAEKHIRHYELERKNTVVHKGVGKQMLFEWPA